MDLLKEEGLHLEAFTTVLAKVESVMNNRPLTVVGAEIDAELPLTPMHFLCPGVYVSSSDEILPPPTPSADALRHSWHHMRSLVEGFWRRWLRDYVSALQAR